MNFAYLYIMKVYCVKEKRFTPNVTESEKNYNHKKRQKTA